MNDLAALAYVSTAVRHVAEQELESLLLDARQFNAQHGVTGVLLYDDGSFFQYLEGPTESVATVYRRFRESTKHFGLIELLKRSVAERSFSSWDMGFTKVPESLILSLAQASWEDVISKQAAQPSRSVGVGLLLEYWAQAARRRR